MKATSHTEAGLTLAEVLISTTIMVGIGGACLSTQLGATSLMNETMVRSTLEERAFFAVKEVAFDTRWAEGAAWLLTAENGSARLDLHTPVDFDHVTRAPVWSSTITYRVVPSSNDANGNGILDEGCLVRVQGATSRVVCDDLVPGGFEATRTGNDVSLEVRLLKTHRGRQVAVTAGTAVTIRN